MTRKLAYIISLLTICISSLTAFNCTGQTRAISMPEHDSKFYYFGISLGVNRSAFKLHYTESFALHDTFRSIQPFNGPGFTMGILGNLNVHKYLTLRFIPALTFANKGIETVNMKNEVVRREMESIFMSLPLQIKFKSDRIRNFRFYGIIGSKFDFDLASNAKSRSQNEWLRINPYDFGFEIGIGFEFYYPNFIFAPELKIGHGLMDLHARDKSIPMSNAIDRINTRMICLTFNLEG